VKKLCIVVLAAVLAAGTAAADPIGLKVYIDGFSFGDMLAEGYDFGKEASITPGIEYSTAFGDLGLTTSVQDEIPFDGEMTIQWYLRGDYGLSLAENSALGFSLYNYLTFSDGEIGDKVGVGVSFTQTLGFGDLYAILELDIIIPTQEGNKLSLTTLEADDGFKVGVNTGFGLYGYLQPVLTFVANGESPADVLSAFNIRLGYATGPIDGRVTVGIPTYTNGFDIDGLGITPRVTYTTPIEGLEAYVEAAIEGVGADSNIKKVGLSPAIGVSFSF
jgi:hypothetical protein